LTTGLKIIGQSLKAEDEHGFAAPERSRKSHDSLILKNRMDVNGYLGRTRKAVKIYLHFMVSSSIFPSGGIRGPAMPQHGGPLI
jgi:hypothetical protein